MGKGPGPEAAKQALILILPPPWDDVFMLVSSALLAPYIAPSILRKPFFLSSNTEIAFGFLDSSPFPGRVAAGQCLDASTL